MPWTLAIPDKLAEVVPEAFEILQNRGDFRYLKRSDLARALLGESAKAIIEGDPKRQKKDRGC